MIRGYDTFRLYCDDTILRIRHLSDEIVALQRDEEKLRKEAAICEDRFRAMKKEMGIPDQEE